MFPDVPCPAEAAAARGARRTRRWAYANPLPDDRRLTKQPPRRRQGWWYKPDFIINELNINSAVSRPWHDEVLPLASDAPYQMAGYAYTGGGRKVTRVEVSLDDGASWQQADIKVYEEPTEWGARGVGLGRGRERGGVL